jgi:hypothetical protein
MPQVEFLNFTGRGSAYASAAALLGSWDAAGRLSEMFFEKPMAGLGSIRSVDHPRAWQESGLSRKPDGQVIVEELEIP